MLRALAVITALLLGGAVTAQDMVIAPQFEDARPFHGGVGRVKQNGMWGLIDRTGRFQVPPTFEQIQIGGQGIYGVKDPDDDRGWRFIRADGRDVGRERGSALKPFSKGWGAVKSYSDRWAVLDTSGKRIAQVEWIDIGGWDPPFATVRDDRGWHVVHIGPYGFVNRVDAWDLNNLQNDLRALRGPFGPLTLLDTSRGFTLMKLETTSWAAGITLSWSMRRADDSDAGFFRNLRAPSEGLAPVELATGGWGFYHLATHQVVWADGLEEARSFSEGLAAVKQNGAWGYLDRRGAVVVRPRYTRAYDFHDGFATMRMGDKRGFLWRDDRGQIAEFVAPQYEDVWRFQEGLAPVKTGGLWGYITNGKAPAPILMQPPVQTLVPALQ